MDSAEARVRLSLYRPGVDDAADPLFAEALELSRQDPELSRWLAQEQALDAALATKLNLSPVPPDLQTNLLVLEQALDAALAAKLKAVPVPSNLKTNLLALGNIIAPTSNPWQRMWRPALAAAAAAAAVTWLAALAVMHSAPSTKIVHAPIVRTIPPPFTEAGSLEDFRAEMISFVKLTPSLEFESKDPGRLRDHLRQEQGSADIQVPKGLLQLPGMGCRMLSFRGHKVALICLQRKNGKLVHLIAVDGSALTDINGTRAQPQIGPEGAWMTAAWKEDAVVYLVAVEGDVPLLNSYLAQTAESLSFAGVLICHLPADVRLQRR